MLNGSRICSRELTELAIDKYSIYIRPVLTIDKKIIKFHGIEVANVTILYSIRGHVKPITTRMEEFDASKDPTQCETINVQVVADFVTITFYRRESTNSIIGRELIPIHAIEHVWVKDLHNNNAIS